MESKEPNIRNWFGGLVDGMRDASGQMYMRNRYYDPATGQFTQPDPIGLAGGLNAYGFAAGDPVSYSDPYGLCKRDKDGNEDPECRLVRDLLRLTAQVADISDQARVELLYAADVYDRWQGAVRFVNAPGNQWGGAGLFWGGTTSNRAQTVDLNSSFNTIDLVMTAWHEAQHMSTGRGMPDGDQLIQLQSEVFGGLPDWLKNQATQTRGYLDYWGTK